MNKKVVVVIVVILLLLLGGWYFMTKKAPSTATPGSTGTTQESPVSSLKDLITKGTAQTCTFNNEGSTGTVYTQGGKVREDFDVTVDNQTMKSHVIVMDNTIYNWSEGQKTGIKMTFDPNATPAAGSTGSTAPKGAVDANANMNYSCSAWVADSSKFTLPSDVNFTSFAIPTVPQTQGAPQQAPAAGGAGSSSQCSYCDSLTGDSKTQCLTALKCN